MCQPAPGPRCSGHVKQRLEASRSAYEAASTEAAQQQGNLNNINDYMRSIMQSYQQKKMDQATFDEHQKRYEVARDSAYTKMEHAKQAAEEHYRKMLAWEQERAATPEGIKKLEEQIALTEDPVELQRLTAMRNVGQRLYNARVEAGKNHQEHIKKSQELEAAARAKYEEAKLLTQGGPENRPLYDSLMAEVKQLSIQSEIERNDGKSNFPALFTVDGRPVPAKLTQTKFNNRKVWGVLKDPNDPKSKYDSFISVSIAESPKKREEFYAKKNLVLGTVSAPAEAHIVENEAGVKSVVVVRCDGGFSPLAEIVSSRGEAKGKPQTLLDAADRHHNK